MFFDSAFGPYAMHKQSIEDFIKLLSTAEDPNDPATQRECAAHAGLQWELLGSDEIAYIEKEVANRWR